MSGEPRLSSQEQNDLLVSLLEEIIPAGSDGRVPSAASPRVLSFLAEQAEQAEQAGPLPGLKDHLDQCLLVIARLSEKRGAVFPDLDRNARVSVVQELERTEPEAFAALIRAVYMGYYTDPTVGPLFGLSAKPPQPDGYDVPEEDPDAIAALVEPVQARGRCYREA
jgi:hypothetical protein